MNIDVDPGKIKLHERPMPVETVADMWKCHPVPTQCRRARNLLEIMGRAPLLIRFDECAADLAARVSVDVVVDAHARYAMVVKRPANGSCPR